MDNKFLLETHIIYDSELFYELKLLLKETSKEFLLEYYENFESLKELNIRS